MTFVDYRLTGKDKDGFEEFFSAKYDVLAEELVQVIANGHRATITWNEKDVCFIASLVCNDERSVNKGCCVSSRSQDWWEALMMSVYKVTKILGDSDWSKMSAGSNWG